MQELCDEFLKRNLGVKFSILCNVRDIEEDMFLKLKEAGLYRLFLGVESGVQRTLNTFTKGVTVEQNKDAIMRVKEMDIGYECGSIFVDPYTTLDEIKENITFWESVDMMSIDQFRDLIVFQGTPLQNKLLKEGRITPENYDYSYSHTIDKDVLKLNKIIDTIRKSYIRPYLAKIRKVRLKARKIMSVHKINNEEIEALLVECGDLFYNWFSKVFNLCLKQVLDEIHNINDENMELKLLMIYRPHISTYEEKYKAIQESFEKVISSLDIRRGKI